MAQVADDFPERLTRVIDVLLKLEFKATLANIDFALCMDYSEITFKHTVTTSR